MFKKILLALCLVFAFGVSAKEVPKNIEEEILSTTVVVHDGDCLHRETQTKVQCTLRQGISEQVLYAIVYDDARSKVNRIVRMTPTAKAVIYCDEKDECGRV
jgi:hypothetical protein